MICLIKLFKPDLNKMFDELNKKRFANKIKKIPVIWNRRLKVTAGWCRTIIVRGKEKPSQIDLSEPIFSLQKFNVHNITEIMIHEMVHAFLIQTSDNKTHDRIFQEMMTSLTGVSKNHTYHYFEIIRNKKREPVCQAT